MDECKSLLAGMFARATAWTTKFERSPASNANGQPLFDGPPSAWLEKVDAGGTTSQILSATPSPSSTF